MYWIWTLPLTTILNNTIMVKTLHCPKLSGTIISSTAIITQYKQNYYGWSMVVDCDKGKGFIHLLRQNALQKDTFPVHKVNDLWFHQDFVSSPNNSKSTLSAHVCTLVHAANFELWHQQLAHPGNRTMENIHMYANGVPTLKGNAFWKCPSCISSKMQKRPIGKNNAKTIHKPVSVISTAAKKCLGQHWHMDFGFMHGSSYKKTDSGSTITSMDGYNSYLLIIERHLRFIWIFLTQSKHPPLEAAKSVLEKFKSVIKHRTVRTDQGGELAKSKDFQNMIGECGFTLEITGSDASTQNGLAENPNCSLVHMVKCLLYSAELPPQYWSFALLHATYIKNRLPHYSLNTTPYKAFTGRKPSLSKLQIFGSIIYG